MQNNPPVPGPLTLGELLDRAFRLVRLRFGQLILITAIFMVPYAIVSGIITGTAMTGYMSFIEEMIGGPTLDASDSPGEILATVLTPLSNFFGLLMLVGLIGLVVQGAATLALTDYHLKLLRQEESSVAQSIKAGARRLMAYIGMLFVEGLAILGVALVVLLIFGCAIGIVAAGAGAASGLLSSADPDAGAAQIAGIVIIVMCLYVLALLLMAAPMIYLWCRWLVATPSLFNEGLGPVEALRRSWRLSKGQVWRTVGYGLLLYILGMIIVSAPAYVIQQIATLFVGAENVAAATGIASALGALFSTIWHPFLVGATVLFYYDLRIRKEGYDLELRIQQMEASAPAATLPDATASASDGSRANNEATDRDHP